MPGSASPMTTWSPSPGWVRAGEHPVGLRPSSIGSPYHVDFVHNTWRFGIDRILAGVAMSDDSHAWIDNTLPLDDVSSNRVELAGQLAEFVCRLEQAADSLTGARPLRNWLAALTDGITMLTRINDSDAWQTSQMQREFAEVLQQAGSRARHLAAAARYPGAARPTPGRTPDPGQLPHRHADRVHDGADALGAAPGGLPGRP